MRYVSSAIQQMHIPEAGNEVSDLPQPKPYFQRSKTPLSSNLLNQHLFSRSRSESVKGETIRLRDQMTKAHSLPNFYSSRALHNRCIGQVLVASEGPLTTSDMRLSANSHVEEFSRLLGDIWFAHYSLIELYIERICLSIWDYVPWYHSNDVDATNKKFKPTSSKRQQFTDNEGVEIFQQKAKFPSIILRVLSDLYRFINKQTNVMSAHCREASVSLLVGHNAL